jgi:hypothetical protein
MLKAMRRTPWGRAFAGVMAVWLAVSLSEPGFLHSCPVHGAMLGAHASMHKAAAHAGPHHGSVDARTPAENDGGQSHTCTCLDHCCCAAPIGLAGTHVALPIGAPTALRDAGVPAYVYVAVAADHVLPFQNGPPETTRI